MMGNWSNWWNQNVWSLSLFQKQPDFKSDDDFSFLAAIRRGFLETHDAMKAVAG